MDQMPSRLRTIYRSGGPGQLCRVGQVGSTGSGNKAILSPAGAGDWLSLAKRRKKLGLRWAKLSLLQVVIATINRNSKTFATALLPKATTNHLVENSHT